MQKVTVGVGLLVADGLGKVSGTGTMRSAGVTCHGSFAGNYAVNNDGTGSVSTNFTTNTPGCFASVVDVSLALYKKGNGAEIANSEND